MLQDSRHYFALKKSNKIFPSDIPEACYYFRRCAENRFVFEGLRYQTNGLQFRSWFLG